jgi:hypothetical protein
MSMLLSICRRDRIIRLIYYIQLLCDESVESYDPFIRRMVGMHTGTDEESVLTKWLEVIDNVLVDHTDGQCLPLYNILIHISTSTPELSVSDVQLIVQSQVDDITVNPEYVICMGGLSIDPDSVHSTHSIFSRLEEITLIDCLHDRSKLVFEVSEYIEQNITDTYIKHHAQKELDDVRADCLNELSMEAAQVERDDVFMILTNLKVQDGIITMIMDGYDHHPHNVVVPKNDICLYDMFRIVVALIFILAVGTYIYIFFRCKTRCD